MTPVPSHLIDYIAPGQVTVSPERSYAELRCTCGARRFELLYPGQTHKYRKEVIPCSAEFDGTFFFLIKSRCTQCRNERLLFDSHFHGWDGFVCHDAKQAAIPRPELVVWKCLKCSATEHEASVRFEAMNREEFVEATAGKLDAARWPDAFSWFSMRIKCVGCGKDTAEWIEYETT